MTHPPTLLKLLITVIPWRQPAIPMPQQHFLQPSAAFHQVWTYLTFPHYISSRHLPASFHNSKSKSPKWQNSLPYTFCISQDPSLALTLCLHQTTTIFIDSRVSLKSFLRIWPCSSHFFFLLLDWPSSPLLSVIPTYTGMSTQTLRALCGLLALVCHDLYDCYLVCRPQQSLNGLVLSTHHSFGPHLGPSETP